LIGDLLFIICVRQAAIARMRELKEFAEEIYFVVNGIWLFGGKQEQGCEDGMSGGNEQDVPPPALSLGKGLLYCFAELSLKDK
jgi:hypothetical protein